MNLPERQVAMVGDRLFTDILAGNRLGIFTILVEPIIHTDVMTSSFHPLRNFEVWVSEFLGASITHKRHRLPKVNKASGTKI